MSQPLVSIVMPMRNAQRFVAHAARSVLAQTYEPLELIVIDDGSTDRSRQIVEDLADPRVRVWDGPARGIAAAMNDGLEHARGQLLLRCDADDLYPPGRVGWQVAWLQAHADFRAVCGPFGVIDARTQVVAEVLGGGLAEEITEELLAGTTRTHLCTFAIETDLLRRIGGFREYFVTAEDIDLQLRLAEVGRVWFEPRLAYLYRLHDASVTHSQDSAARRHYEDMAGHFAAQRRSGCRDDLAQGQPPVPPRAARMRPSPAGEQIQGMLIGRSWEEHQAGRRSRALWLGLQACLRRPVGLAGWRNLAALCIKKGSYSP